MASVTVDMQPLPDSTAPKRLCPLKHSVLLDVFSEIIADSSKVTPDSSATSELEKYLSDPVIDYKTGDPYKWWVSTKLNFLI